MSAFALHNSRAHHRSPGAVKKSNSVQNPTASSSAISEPPSITSSSSASQLEQRCEDEPTKLDRTQRTPSPRRPASSLLATINESASVSSHPQSDDETETKFANAEHGGMARLSNASVVSSTASTRQRSGSTTNSTCPSSTPKQTALRSCFCFLQYFPRGGEHFS
jgi:hypothetical protein